MLTKSGYTIKTQREYLSEIIDRLREFFPVNEEDYANLMVVLANIIAENENRRDNEIAVLYNNVYVSTATGSSLDRAVFVAGITRAIGDKATGRVLIEKDETSSFIILPPGALLVSNNIYFRTLNQSGIVISDDTYEVAVEATDIGYAGNIANGANIQSVNAIPGIASIVSIGAFTGGTDSESDFSLRERYGIAINSNKNSALINIVSQVKSVGGVTLCYAYENLEDEINEIGMSPRSIAVYVLGGNELEIAKAIIRSKAGGISMFGTTVVNDVNIDGVEYVVKFTIPEATPVYYDVTVSLDKNRVPSNIEQIVKDAIVSFGTNVRYVRGYDLNGDISQAHESINGVMLSMFDVTPNPTNTLDLMSAQGEYYYTDFDKIQVQVVLE